MFNSYNPYGNFPISPQTQSPFMPPNMPVQPQQQQVNMWAYVNGLEGAKAYIVPPNGKMILMDSDNPIFYLKSANEAGQANIRTFRFEEVQTTASAAPTPAMNYAKAEDLNALNARIAKIEEVLKNGNGTGIAGTSNNP